MGKRHRRIRARSATGQVAGAATEKPGLKRPSSKNRPAQHAFSQKPLSRSPDPNPGRRQNNSLRAPFSCPEPDSWRSSARAIACRRRQGCGGRVSEAASLVAVAKSRGVGPGRSASG